MRKWFRKTVKGFAGVLATALSLSLVQAPARADSWWRDDIQSTDWGVVVNGSNCKLTGVVMRNGTFYVPVWQFHKCVPGLYYHSDDYNFVIMSYTLHAGLPGEHQLQLRVDMNNPDPVHLVRYDGFHDEAGVYPDGASREQGSDGEAYDTSWYQESPFYRASTDTNYFSIRQLANTFNWELQYNSGRGVIYVDTTHSYQMTGEEKDALTKYSWSTLSDHSWARGTPATVRAMRAYTNLKPIVERKLTDAGVNFIEDPYNFRIRALVPGYSKLVDTDFYLVGESPYVVKWLHGRAAYDDFSAQIHSISSELGKSLELGGVVTTAFSVAAVKTAGTATAGTLTGVASGAAIGTAVLAVLGVHYWLRSSAMDACDRQIERDNQDIPPGNVKVGLVFRQDTNGYILGCVSDYTDRALNNHGI